MANEKIYAKGVRAFKPNEKAPSWVKASVVITPNDLNQFLKENSVLLTEYNGSKQIRLQLLENDKGLYFVVDTYKKDDNSSFNYKDKKYENKDEMPF